MARNSEGSRTVSLYIHIPFCRSRCSYCVFNTYVGLEHLITRYVAALCNEITLLGKYSQHPIVHTVYFGGGTPSVLSPPQVARILRSIADSFSLSDEAEISLEANPSGVDVLYFRALRQIGVNRLSLGAQSADVRTLQLFNRDHTWRDVVQAVRSARQAGFRDVSLDLIYGAPEQSLEAWARTLDETLLLAPDHLSLYSLGIEPGSAMNVWIGRGSLPAPDVDLAADMYEYASGRLVQAGFEQYEISNWSLPGYTCRHNIQYWRNLPYLGVGAGAYGFTGALRYSIVASPAEYIRRLQSVETAPEGLSPAVNQDSIEYVDRDQLRAETMMLGLRLLQEGVSRSRFADRFGGTVEAYYEREIETLKQAGLIHVMEDRIVLTAKARLIGNRVFMCFV